MSGMLRRGGAFVIAVALMAFLGSLAQTWRVQQAWSLAAGAAGGGAAVPIPLRERLDWFRHDLVGLALPYGVLGSIALLTGFLVAAYVVRRTGHPSAVFAAAGGAAILSLFELLRAVLGTFLMFGARGAVGLALQVGAGVLAGLIFARLTDKERT